MTPRWPDAPTYEQARALAAAWCLAPVARRLLGDDATQRAGGLIERPAAVLLIAEHGESGHPHVFLAEWTDEGLPDAGAALRRSERGHALLSEIYAGDPLVDMGDAAAAFRPYLGEHGAQAIVAIATQDERREVSIVMRDPEARPDLETDGRTCSPLGSPVRVDVELAARHRALRRLNELKLRMEHVDSWRPRGSARDDGLSPPLANALAELRACVASIRRTEREARWEPSDPTPIAGSTSAELREAYLELRVRPLAQRLFQAAPEARSVLCCIAQFWDDEALDAVHELFVPCAVPGPPPWPECLRDNPFTDDAGGPDGSALSHWWIAIEEIAEGLPDLDDNTTRVAAFASCIGTMATQDDDFAEAFRPYALARRLPGNLVDIRILGSVLRPEWEDRMTWEQREPFIESMTEPDPRPAPSPPPAPRPWWERLLRRLGGSR